jgi:hypothetical protein
MESVAKHLIFELLFSQLDAEAAEQDKAMRILYWSFHKVDLKWVK